MAPGADWIHTKGTNEQKSFAGGMIARLRLIDVLADTLLSEELSNTLPPPRELPAVSLKLLNPGNRLRALANWPGIIERCSKIRERHQLLMENPVVPNQRRLDDGAANSLVSEERLEELVQRALGEVSQLDNVAELINICGNVALAATMVLHLAKVSALFWLISIYFNSCNLSGEHRDEQQRLPSPSQAHKYAKCRLRGGVEGSPPFWPPDFSPSFVDTVQTQQDLC